MNNICEFVTKQTKTKSNDEIKSRMNMASEYQKLKSDSKHRNKKDTK